ncbi:MAG: hypothetical protein IJ438_12470, partial [Clostridia bacterium]|nr:hypothetical protein [Clostridia bacterium]
MYQQGYQDGPNGNGQERGWYADPPYQDAPAPRRRSRSRGQNDRDTGAPSQQGGYGYAQNGVSHRADQPGGYPGGYEEPAGPYDSYAYDEPAYREPN